MVITIYKRYTSREARNPGHVAVGAIVRLSVARRRRRIAASGEPDGGETSMCCALPSTDGYAIANYGGAPIPEIGIAGGTLHETDCHFGINGYVASVSRSALSGAGPRAIDMETRGGIIAEHLWEEYKSKPATYSGDLQQFLITFHEVGETSLLDKGKYYQYPQDAKITKPLPAPTGNNNNAKLGKSEKTDDVTQDVTGDLKYLPGKANKTMKSIVPANAGLFGQGGIHQLGARWSKVAIERTILLKGRIHFHLDGMGDIRAILLKQGDHSHNTTSRELRYIFRNWGRTDVQKSSKFYNGYDDKGRAVLVACPWNW